MAMETTWALAFGFHAVTAPVVASSAAIRLRGCPPTLVKYPPAYTVEPLTARANTLEAPTPLTEGSHPVATPLAASSAARFLRAYPPRMLKPPPTYTVEPFTASAFTR